MGVVYEAIGGVVLAGGALTAAGHYARLSTRRTSRLRQVATAPAGRFVRTSLGTAMTGLWLLTDTWVAVGLLTAVVAWELAVDGRALLRRARRRAPTG